VEATGRRRGGKDHDGCAQTKIQATVGRWEEEFKANSGIEFGWSRTGEGSSGGGRGGWCEEQARSG